MTWDISVDGVNLSCSNHGSRARAPWRKRPGVTQSCEPWNLGRERSFNPTQGTSKHQQLASLLSHPCCLRLSDLPLLPFLALNGDTMGPKRKLYGAAAAAVERKRLRQLRLAEETAATGPPTSADPVESGEDPIHRELNALAISGAALPDRPEDAIEYAKRRLENYKEKNEKNKTPLVLNAFLDFLPKDGKQNLITDIVTRPEDEDLHQLVRQLRAHIIVPCKFINGPA